LVYGHSYALWSPALNKADYQKVLNARDIAIAKNSEFFCWWCPIADLLGNDLKHIHDSKYWGERLPKQRLSLSTNDN
jgi:hypothetical protein